MKIKTYLLTTICLWLFLAGPSHAMAPPPPAPPVPMECVGAAFEPDCAAIVIELTVPNAAAVGALDRIEILIIDAKARALFGALQNLSDRCAPVPPGAFGVVIDPASEDRSIRNVASAGQNGQWDQEAPGGVLLKESAGGLTGGKLGIAFRIAPKGWASGRYLVAARAVRKKSRPEPWRHLATFEYAGNGTQNTPSPQGRVKPVFKVAGADVAMPMEHIGSVILVEYDRREQAKGVTSQRWPGDKSGRYQFVELNRRQLKPSDLPGDTLLLGPGFYQFKHNSVSGQPPSEFYGESAIFEIRAGEETIEIHVPLYQAI
jgi:hypothetical protein